MHCEPLRVDGIFLRAVNPRSFDRTPSGCWFLPFIAGIVMCFIGAVYIMKDGADGVPPRSTGIGLLVPGACCILAAIARVEYYRRTSMNRT